MLVLHAGVPRYGLPMCLMVIDLENRLPNPEGWIGWIRHEFGES